MAFLKLNKFSPTLGIGDPVAVNSAHIVEIEQVKDVRTEMVYRKDDIFKEDGKLELVTVADYSRIYFPDGRRLDVANSFPDLMKMVETSLYGHEVSDFSPNW